MPGRRFNAHMRGARHLTCKTSHMLCLNWMSLCLMETPLLSYPLPTRQLAPIHWPTCTHSAIPVRMSLIQVDATVAQAWQVFILITHTPTKQHMHMHISPSPSVPHLRFSNAVAQPSARHQLCFCNLRTCCTRSATAAKLAAGRSASGPVRLTAPSPLPSSGAVCC
jgi:hypothetical protein